MPESLCRITVEATPRDGTANMAADEALLEAATRGETTMRVYRWSEPTLSLGHFQKALPPDLPDALRALPCVRRLSGGGAVLHHHEWTYAVGLPKAHPLADRPESLYLALHAALTEAFGRHGVTARLRGDADRAAEGNFLCFRRGDPRDLLVADRKVVGSAQRRRKGAVLQHGSVLLRRSALVPEIPGMFELAPNAPREPMFAVPEFVLAVRRALDGASALSEK